MGGQRSPQVEVVVPVRNEERDLPLSVRRLHRYLADVFPFTTVVTIVDNGSSDGTWPAALALAAQLDGVRALRLDQPGRGRALRTAWERSDAQVLAYMDVDLSTDLNALLPLVAPLLSGHSDVAIGTRLSRSAQVVRGPRRELISRCYNVLLHATLATHFSDAQCGFKAVRADRARALLPLVEDTGWFFDTELLVLAERAGLRIHEVPVDWVDDLDSRVDVVATAVGDLKGVARLARGLATGSIAVPTLRAAPAVVVPGLSAQVLRFAAVGVASTLGYVALYVALRLGVSAQAANALALLLTAIGNTAANRHYTFAVRGGAGVLRHQVQGLVVFALALGVTAGSLVLLHQVDPLPSRPVEVAVLVVANLTATALRFLLLRHWVFHVQRRTPALPSTTRVAEPAPTVSRSA